MSTDQKMSEIAGRMKADLPDRLLKAGVRRYWNGAGDYDQNAHWVEKIDPLMQEAATALTDIPWLHAELTAALERERAAKEHISAVDEENHNLRRLSDESGQTEETAAEVERRHIVTLWADKWWMSFPGEAREDLLAQLTKRYRAGRAAQQEKKP